MYFVVSAQAVGVRHRALKLGSPSKGLGNMNHDEEGAFLMA
jgi:hypothetical protein